MNGISAFGAVEVKHRPPKLPKQQQGTGPALEEPPSPNPTRDPELS
jgi:hypothetical protein